MYMWCLLHPVQIRMIAIIISGEVAVLFLHRHNVFCLSPEPDSPILMLTGSNAILHQIDILAIGRVPG